MKNKKLLSLLLCATLAASMLIGCGGKEETTTTTDVTTEVEDTTEEVTEEVTEETAEPTEVVEIHHALWHDALIPYMEECKANFEAANPGITIVFEPTAWGEYWTKLETAATGGTVADVFQLNGPNNYKYADYGMLLPLDDYIANSDVDLSNYSDAMNSLYNIDGVQYGIPVDWDTIGLWYNKELFDAAGVEYPNENWTWDDLVAAAAAITDEANGVYGMAAGYDEQNGLFNTVAAAGGYLVSEDGKTSGFDNEATIKGIKVWTDLIEAGYSPSNASLTENPGYVQFMSGKIGMLMAGDWFAATFITDPEFATKIDVTMLPTIDGNRASCIHGKANVISSSTEHPDEAWAWVSYLAGAEANEIMGKSGAAIPAYLDYAGLFFEAYADYGYNMGVFSQMASECASAYPTSRGYNEWATVMFNELSLAYALEVPVEEACKNIAAQMNEILAAYN